jgi:GTPase SAR1 family protein
MSAVPSETAVAASDGFAHLRPSVRPVALQSDVERIAFIDSRPWVKYDRATKAIDALTTLMNTPKRARMPNLLLVGSSNNGKTSLIQRFQDSFPNYVNEDVQAVKQVIVADAPPTADEKGLYGSILDQFWAPWSPTGTALALRKQAVHTLRDCNTRVLVIDEFHALLAGTPKKQREVMNALKYLCNEVQIPIVGVGTQDAVLVIKSDPQYSSRFSKIELPDWQLGIDFQRLAQSFEAVLPLRKGSNLHGLPIVNHLHSISAGNLGNLHELLIECAKQAIKSGTEQITLDIVNSKSWIRPTKGIREIEL